MTRALILLDTNVVLYLLGNRLTSPLPSGQYFVSVITEIELLSYPSLSSDEEVQIRDFLTKITVVEIDSNIKELAIAFRKQYKLRLPDAIIAATAKFLNAMLFTNEVRLVPQGGSQKSKVKSQKYYGMGFLGILNGCSIYAVTY